MIDTLKCATCRWFEPEPRKSTADNLGECRIKWPSASDGWPKVNPDDWCGDWNDMKQTGRRKA